MKAKYKAILDNIQIQIQNLFIKNSKEKWNFFTNATTENQKQLLNSTYEIVNFFTNNSDIEELIYAHKKHKTVFNKEETEILNKIKFLKKQYEKKSTLSELLAEKTIDFQYTVINKRINYNSKHSTTNYLSDLCERETSISRVKELQKTYYFQPVEEYKNKYIELFILRNRYYQERGFDNYYSYFLKKNNITHKHVLHNIEKLDKLTLSKYKKIKSNLEKILVKKFNCRSKKIANYIYGDPFFRHFPVHVDENVNIMFKGKDIAYTVKKFYQVLGVNLDNIYEVSDLYIRPGKYQNPIIIDIDRKGDVRFSLNAKSNYRGIFNTLRYISKVVYIMNMSNDIPFILKDCPYRGIVESFSMFMTDYAFRSGIIAKIIAQYEEEDEQLLMTITDYLDLTEIIYLRFQLALANFEINAYTDEKHSLTDIWLKSIKKYQLIDKNSIYEQNAWTMLESLLSDPFSSLWEIEGYLLRNKFSQIKSKHNLHDKSMLKFFIDHIISKGPYFTIKDLNKLTK